MKSTLPIALATTLLFGCSKHEPETDTHPTPNTKIHREALTQSHRHGSRSQEVNPITRPAPRETELRATVVTSPEHIGQELSVASHLANGEEFQVSLDRLLRHGEALFVARWTTQEGQGRPFGKGNDGALTDPDAPLSFPHNFNRISGPAAGSCSGCHNQPRDGGGGDLVGAVFVLGNRFDFATFDPNDPILTKGRLDERGIPATFQSISNPRKTTGMFGSGFIEMLTRQMTDELRAQAADCAPGTTCSLHAKGISFGSVTHNADGTWETAAIEGLPPRSVESEGTEPPSLILQPFFQSGAVVSLRDFTVNAFNRLHGMQSEERFGTDQDPDRDGFVNELTIADITAITVFQATLPPPGQVIPRQRAVERAILTGERVFEQVGCASCHIPRLPLTSGAWEFSEPGPYNPSKTLQLEDVEATYDVDLTNPNLPSPRLSVEDGKVWVAAYTDFKLHDITSGLPSCASHPELIATNECDPDVEPLNQNHAAGTEEFFAGTSRFLTRRLWGMSNQHAFGHHGQYTTIRESILAHRGEANAVREAFENLTSYRQNAIIEFIKSLQVLPAGAKCLVVDEHGRCRSKRTRHR